MIAQADGPDAQVDAVRWLRGPRRYILVYCGMAIAVAALLSSINIWYLRRLSRDGRQTIGVVRETSCSSHNSFTYSITVQGLAYGGADIAEFGVGECSKLRMGDSVQVWYLPSDPTQQVAGDVHAALQSRLGSPCSFW